MQVDETPSAGSGQASQKILGPKTTSFVTPKPDGSMTDVLTIECPKMNGNPFKGSITYTEARSMFTDSLSLAPGLLHSVKI